MKAVIINRFGPASVLQLTEIDKPTPGEGQVLLKIKAIGINPVDTKVRAGTSGISNQLQLPAILGWDASGVVETCGQNVTRFKPGDEVFGCIGFPGMGKAYAEYALADADILAKKPSNISFEAVAAIPIAGLTAYQSLNDHLKLQAGQTILIQAAAGGVGHFTVQLARLKNAYVIGTASAKNKDLLQSLGTDQVIDYKNERFEDTVKDVDAVQDAMGGDVLYRSISCLKPGGRIVCLPSSTKDDPKAIALAKKENVALIWPMMYGSGEQLQILAGLLETKKLQVHIDRIFPLDEMAKAHEWIETHGTVGKVVVKVD